MNKNKPSQPSLTQTWYPLLCSKAKLTLSRHVKQIRSVKLIPSISRFEHTLFIG